MIRINTGADLEDMWGGQIDFEVSVTLSNSDGTWDIIGAGHTVAEAVAAARETFQEWRAYDATMETACSECGVEYIERSGVKLCECNVTGDDLDEMEREHIAEGRMQADEDRMSS